MGKQLHQHDPETQVQHSRNIEERDAAIIRSDHTGSIRRWLRLADEMFSSDDDLSPNAA
jgi:hypothetical protein